MSKSKTKDFITNSSPKEVTEKSGIYEIVTPSGGKYIGMTSTSFYDRWQGHLRRLNKNTHHNQALQRAFHKYGEDNFTFNIIYSYKAGTVSKNELYKLEKDYWDYCKLRGQKLYNGRPSKGSTEHSLETRTKISENMLKNNPYKFNKGFILSRNINKVLEYANSPINMKDASIKLGCSYGVLNKFIKENNIEWINSKQYFKKHHTEIFENNLTIITELANDLSVSKIEGSKRLGIPLKIFNMLLKKHKIAWLGGGVKPSSIKYMPAINDIKNGIIDVQYLVKKHSLTRENIYYLKKRFKQGLL